MSFSHKTARLLIVILSLIAMALAVACAQASEPPVPTPEPVPPTATPAPPTETPTETPQPSPTPSPTAGPAPTPTAPPPTATAVPRPTPRVIRSRSQTEDAAAPDFEVETFAGETLRLSDLEGQVVVLNFWASWCPPCRWEMPAFEEISREYRDRGVTFVGIAMSDTLEDAKGFADQTGVTYPLALDTTNEVVRAYQVRTLPTTFFIDKDGRIQRRLTSAANEGMLKVFIRGQLAD